MTACAGETGIARIAPAGGRLITISRAAQSSARRTVTEDRDSWLELLQIRDADATIWEVVVACPGCGMRQDFRGTDSEIGEAAGAWKKVHQCAAPVGSQNET